MGRVRNFVGICFWARGYFVSTVGRDGDVVRMYIQDQGRSRGPAEAAVRQTVAQPGPLINNVLLVLVMKIEKTPTGSGWQGRDDPGRGEPLPHPLAKPART